MVTTRGHDAPVLDPRTVRAYLDRIGHGPVGDATTDVLASLQDAHVRTVPFENLDIHLGLPLSLAVPDLAEKVTARRRGGFCYELNGLFRALLVSLGFTARLVEARTREDDGTLGPRFDHARILVEAAGGMLLVDVGTGASPRAPIRLDERPQRIGHEWYRVRADGDRYDSERLEDGTWTHDWSFDATPRSLVDFAERCGYHEHSPDSRFTQKLLCTLVTDDGHVTLSDRRLITTRAGQRHEQEVDDPLAVLSERFGVTIPHWPGS